MRIDTDAAQSWVARLPDGRTVDLGSFAGGRYGPGDHICVDARLFVVVGRERTCDRRGWILAVAPVATQGEDLTA